MGLEYIVFVSDFIVVFFLSYVFDWCSPSLGQPEQF